MSQLEARELLRAQTGDALAAIQAVKTRREGRGETTAQPGDLFALPQTRDLPVEWLLLRRREDGGVFVIAADTYPSTGSSDVALPASAASGPLFLRCGFGAWIDASVLLPELRSGTVEEIYLGHARRKLTQVETGSATGSWTERQIDGDLEYRDWARDVLAEALARLTGNSARAAAPSPRLAPQRASWLGWAVAALLTLTFSAQLLWQRRQIEQMSLPSINPPSIEIQVGDVVRSPLPVGEIPASAALLNVFLSLPVEPEHTTYRVELFDADGKSVWRSPETPPNDGCELDLSVPTPLLHDGLYRLRIERRRAGAFELVNEESFEIRFLAQSRPR